MKIYKDGRLFLGKDTVKKLGGYIKDKVKVNIIDGKLYLTRGPACAQLPEFVGESKYHVCMEYGKNWFKIDNYGNVKIPKRIVEIVGPNFKHSWQGKDGGILVLEKSKIIHCSELEYGQVGKVVSDNYYNGIYVTVIYGSNLKGKTLLCVKNNGKILLKPFWSIWTNMEDGRDQVPFMVEVCDDLSIELVKKC